MEQARTVRSRPDAGPRGLLGYLLAALLGSIIGGLLVGWMLHRTSPVASAPLPALTPAEGRTFSGGTDVGSAAIQAVRRVGPTVVNINTLSAPPPSAGGLPEELRRFFGVPERESRPRAGLGSGFISDRERGLVITNHHVVAGADRIRVTLPDRRSFTGKVLGSDPIGDIALLRIEANNLPEVELGDSARLEPGAVAIAIGTPWVSPVASPSASLVPWGANCRPRTRP
jgi:S1-C subfamily serine protease